MQISEGRVFLVKSLKLSCVDVTSTHRDSTLVPFRELLQNLPKQVKRKRVIKASFLCEAALHKAFITPELVNDRVIKASPGV